MASYPLEHDDPQRLGGYRLLARLGSGGMGSVYLGRSPRGRTVALKTMYPGLAAQPEFRTRFQLEVDAARVMGAHHGAEVVDADPLAETPWMATEYVLGPPLDVVVTLCGTLPENAVRGLGARLCAALAQLHASDVVHRDLKPSNILLSATGPKVIDFGIARAAGDDRLTRTGAAAGTPAFMSPEQATGREHTPAGDVFALAGVLVFASTGRGPFGTGQAADLLYRVRYGEPDLSQVPDGLVDDLARCLSKNPDERPTTPDLADRLGGDGEEFADLLPDTVHQEILRRSELVWEAPPPRLAAPTGEPGGRTTASERRAPARRRVLALGGAGLAVAATGAGAWLMTRPGSTPRAGTPAPPSKTAAAAGPTPVWQAPFDDGGTDIALAGDHVAVAAEGNLVTIDSKGNSSRKREVLNTDGAVSDGDHLFMAPEEDAVYRIDPKTGKNADRIAAAKDMKLRETFGVTVRAAYQGVVAVEGKPEGSAKSDTGTHYLGVEVKTGKILWRRAVRDPERTSILAATDGKLILFRLGDLWALDVTTGEVAWSRTFLKNMEQGWSSICVDGKGHLYLGLREIVALRTSDGRTVWRFGKDRKLPRRPPGVEVWTYGMPAYRDGSLYTWEPGGTVVALDAGSGHLRWEAKDMFPTAQSPSFPAPVAGDRYVYFPAEDSRVLTAVDRKKRQVAWVTTAWKREELVDMAPHRGSHQLVVATSKRVFALPMK